MHACDICGKNFPRPSGLKTHMNTHTHNKPFSCAYPGCERTFTVRSNAKRHLRTHGIHPEDAIADSMIPRSTASEYEVSFDEPVVQQVDHELTSVVPRLRWMPPSLSSRENASSLKSIPEDSDSEWEDGKEDPIIEQCALSLAIPLRPVIPYEVEDPVQDDYTEERDSYGGAASYPYHASQYHRLPGPAANNS
ncbi:hypothetical protein F5878DRAFT_589393 [Lentinula raphanica]|uniref:C2H2-type domain-containing protein n=1 Tax=Lentinula raphanica TaxID=153919 RepID=A0AA38P1B6_9AGAR|nr:hypothetical protein F5878DRAFT_589393 [Lentinula raphanica]